MSRVEWHRRVLGFRRDGLEAPIPRHYAGDTLVLQVGDVMDAKEVILLQGWTPVYNPAMEDPRGAVPAFSTASFVRQAAADEPLTEKIRFDPKAKIRSDAVSAVIFTIPARFPGGSDR
jgi:hypothetical protein